MENIEVTSQRCKIFIVLILLFICHSTYAASSKPASVLLQEGLYAEEVEGNLDGAIKIYQEVITASQQMEQSAAQATYRIALCYLKKGDTEQAAKQFSELVTKYPEQNSLVNEAQKQLEKLQPQLTLGFTPVIDLDIPCIISGQPETMIDKTCLLDFDTARLFSLPEKFNPKEDEKEIKNWLRENKIDAAALGGGKFAMLGQEWLNEDNFVKISNNLWNSMSPQEIKDNYHKETGADDTRYEELPATFAFKTIEENYGLLQILSTTDETIKIRYKMVNQEREGFLPNADDFIHEGAPVILNLSTGNFINGYFDKDYLKDLKEGDIAYMDDEGKDVIACFRGTKITRKLKNGQYSNTPDQSHTDTNMNLYIIDIPSEMFVTTKEGETYDLNILSKVSKGLNIKYAKTPPRQLEKLQPPVTYSFSPVIEKILQDDGQLDSWIDFDTGKTYSPPEEIQHGPDKEGIAWVRQHGIDASAEDGIQGFNTIDLNAIRLNNFDWKNLDPPGLLKLLQQEKGFIKSFNQGVFDIVKLIPDNSRVFGFETREGGIGIIQIEDILNDPWRIKIRYKMVSQEREVFVPDADTPDVGVVLDLASGELLKAGTGEEQLTIFRNLGKGDIAFDRVLICIRGAKAYRIESNANGEYLTNISPFDQREDWTAYNLETETILPVRYMVTTAEGDNYDLNILSANSEGLYIKYAKTIMQPEVAKTASTNDSGETGGPEAAAKMIAPLYGMFSSAYDSLMSNNDPNTAQAIIEMALPQFDIFENLMKGTDSSQSISMAIQVVREINEALKNGEIEKAKSLFNVLHQDGPDLEEMVEEAVLKAENSETKESLTPVVIKTEPENYSIYVSPDTKEISVTFNKEMADKSWSWVKWNYTFPETTGQPYYDNTKTTCTLPVKLEPGKAYLLRINAGQYSSFMSSEKIKAQPFVFVFATLDASGKPTTIPEEMLNFAKQINSASPASNEKSYIQESHSEITPDGLINYKGVSTIINKGSSIMTNYRFMSSDFARVTAMKDNNGKPLKFTTTHNGNIFQYNVTLNKPVKPGDALTYSTEGTMTGMIKTVTGKENTFSYHLSHAPNAGTPTQRIETYLLPKGAELVSTNPANMQQTEKDGRIELRHEKLIPVGGGIVTEFQYKLEK